MWRWMGKEMAVLVNEIQQRLTDRVYQIVSEWLEYAHGVSKIAGIFVGRGTRRLRLYTGPQISALARATKTQSGRREGGYRVP